MIIRYYISLAFFIKRDLNENDWFRMQNPLVVAVVLNWNAENETIECVRSLLNSTYNNLEIVIIDNASTDHSVEKFNKLFPQVKLIVNSLNTGYAGGNNLGIKWALSKNAEFVLILNNDVVVETTMIEKLVKGLQKNSKVGLITGKVYYKEDTNRIFSGAGRFIRWRCTGVNRGTLIGRTYLHDRECFVNYISGVLFLAKSEIFESIGLLDEKFFMYFEDLEFSMRVLKNYLIAYTPDAIAYHKSGGGTRWSNYSETYLYYQTRNRFIVFENENLFYRFYVVIFSTFVTIAKSTAILLSNFRLKKVNKTKLRFLWAGFKDGILYYLSNQKSVNS